MGVLRFFTVLCLLFPAISQPLSGAEVKFAWSGAVTHNSVRIGVLADEDIDLKIVLSTEENRFDKTKGMPGEGPMSADFFQFFSLNDLEEGTDYYYAFVVNGKLQNDGHRFKTFRTEPYSFSVAFGSCAQTGSEAKTFTTIRSLEPNFFLHTGDLHYENIGDNCTERFKKAYRSVWKSATQKELYKNIPIAYVWDDHDFGPNDSGKENPCAKEAVAAYKQHVPHYPLELANNNGPISQAFRVGRVRFVLTDLRSQKRKPMYSENCERTQAGSNFGSTEHLDWFKQQLLDAKENGEFVYWLSGIPFVNAPDGPNYKCNEKDNWGGYPEERKQIANFIQKNEINISVLAGDAHMVAIDDGTNTRYADNDSKGIPVFHAAPLDRSGSYKGGPYSHGHSSQTGQFGLIEVIDEGGDEICFRWTGYDADGNVLLSVEENKPIQMEFCEKLD